MKLRLLVVAILILTGTLTWAAEATQKPVSNNNHVYTEDDQNILVTADHPQFTIQLKSNPTTGFSWFLREYDPNLIAPVKQAHQASKDNKMMGAPGTESWTFRVKPAGFVVPQQTTIRLIYSRPWQSADSATQTVFRVSTGKVG